MFNFKLVPVAGLLTALGTALAAYAQGDYLSAIGIAAAAFSSTAIKKLSQAPLDAGA